MSRISLFPLLAICTLSIGGCVHVNSSESQTVVGRIYPTSYTVYIDRIGNSGGEYKIKKVETISNGYNLDYIYGVDRCKDSDVYVDIEKFDSKTLFSIKFYLPKSDGVFDFEEGGKKGVGVAKEAIECKKLSG